MNEFIVPVGFKPGVRREKNHPKEDLIIIIKSKEFL
jgi:hypothetical protein